MRLKITLAYDGAAYEGWQIQLSPRRPPTVQGAVEAALFTLCGTPVRVTGASRTDAGVHALGQVCHADVPDRYGDWRARLNAVLPRDIRVIAARRADAGFHARRDATGKTYFYNFWLEPAWTAPALRGFVWSLGQVDWQAMRDAAPAFIGRHDFASFQNAGTPLKSTVREITAISLDFPPPDVYPPAALLRLTVSGNGFLKQMVRNMAGYLAAVGKGCLAAADLAAVLKAKDRKALKAATAPAQGLFLQKVAYGRAGK